MSPADMVGAGIKTPEEMATVLEWRAGALEGSGCTLDAMIAGQAAEMLMEVSCFICGACQQWADQGDGDGASVIAALRNELQRQGIKLKPGSPCIDLEALAAAAREGGDVKQAPGEAPQSGPAKQGNAPNPPPSQSDSQ